MELKAIPLSGVKGPIATYFNWAANALVPFSPGGADEYMRQHRATIESVANHFLSRMQYRPEVLYRGVILREPVTKLLPKPGLEYISFSTDLDVALHFADVYGFGSEILDVRKQLGDYGYIIKYQPVIAEILFHHSLLDILPFREAYDMVGIDGYGEVDALKKQKEVMIIQPTTPMPIHPIDKP